MSDPHRTLPIRVPPLPGEALDSWLDAMAWRLNTPIAQLRQALGLTRYRVRSGRPGGGQAPDWAVLLSDIEAGRVAAATGLPPAAVHAMTLRRYDGRLLLLDHERRAVKQRNLWGRRAGSWCCPACLAESGGRWPLAWRLVWRFACIRHNVLLVDRCPACRRVPRSRSVRLRDVVEPGRCSQAGPMTTGSSGRASGPCGQDLRVADAVAIPADSPVLSAQRAIDQIIEQLDAPVTYLGVKHGNARAFLDDLRLLATRILNIARDDDLVRFAPAEFMSRRYELHPKTRGGKRSRHLLAPMSCAVVAATVTAAFDVLDAPNVPTAAQRIGWLMQRHREVGAVMNPTAITHYWGRHSSEGLHAVLLTAIDAELPLGRNARLRYRMVGSRPALPTAATRAAVTGRTRWIPSVLWPRWALLLTPIDWLDPTIYHAVASCMLAMIGATDNQDEVARRLGGLTDGPAISSMLRRLAHRGILERVTRTLGTLASRLDVEGAPIDYQRRRVTFTNIELISRSQWQTIHVNEGAGGPGGRTARLRHLNYYLFELLTGCPPHVGLGTAASSSAAAGYRTFRRHMTIPVDQALRQHAHALLAARGIDEPLAWQPPLEWASEAEWLAPDPEALDFEQIRQALHAEHAMAGTVAKRLGVSIAHIRYVTERHPIDPSSLSWVLSPAAAVMHRNHTALLPAYLRQRYEIDGLSHAEVAAETGVARSVVQAHAKRAGIRSRPVGSRVKVEVDVAWFAREYVENQRTLFELAMEAGTSPTTLSRIAKAAGIPLRARGGSRPRRRAKVSVDLGWFAREYFENKRTLAELAAQAGTAPSTLSRIAKAAGIPLRPSSTSRSRAPDQQGGSAISRSRTFGLGPAPVGSHGWRRGRLSQR